MNNITSSTPGPNPTLHKAHENSTLWPLLAFGMAGALIAAPYVLPLISIGNTGLAEDTINIMHSHDGSSGTGLAGLLYHGLSQIPLVGAPLAAGGWTSILTTGIIGIGGMLLANWMEKHEDPTKFHWSKIVRYAALTTSILISLPAILTGISIGLTYIISAMPVSYQAVNSTISWLDATLGSANIAITENGSSGLIALALPHLLSCGASIIPVSLAYFIGSKSPNKQIQTNTAELQTPQKPLQSSMPAL